AARGLDLSAQRTNVCGEVPGDETADGVASRCEGFALAAAREAVADAGLSDPLPRAGVFLGGSTAGMAEGEAWFQRARCGDHRSSRPLAAYLLSAPGDAVARAFGVRGRVLSLSSACASGALAIAAAVAAIRRGELEIAL